MTLVERSINKDGLILKPSRPLATPDYLLWQNSSSNVELETFSEIDGWRFGIILLSNVGRVNLDIKNYQFFSQHREYVSVEFKNGKYRPRRWNVENQLVTDKNDLTIQYTSPLWHMVNHTLALLGELGKWTPVSPQRFTKIDVNKNFVRIDFKGAPFESVSMKFLLGDKNETSNNYIVKNCIVGKSGRHQILIDSSGKFIC